MVQLVDSHYIVREQHLRYNTGQEPSTEHSRPHVARHLLEMFGLHFGVYVGVVGHLAGAHRAIENFTNHNPRQSLTPYKNRLCHNTGQGA